MSEKIETKPLSDSDKHNANAERLSSMWKLLNDAKGIIFQLEGMEPRLREALYNYDTDKIKHYSTKMAELTDKGSKLSSSMKELSNSVFTKEDFGESEEHN